MAHCKVNGTSPGKGPGQLTAQAAMDTVNDNNAGWNCTMNWNSSDVTYASTDAGATADAMETAFEAQFPAYTVTGY